MPAEAPPSTSTAGEIGSGTFEKIQRTAAMVVPFMVELLRLLPDGVVLGVAILTLVSFCKSYTILLLSMIELMLLQRVFASVVGSISPTGAGANAQSAVCMPGFMYSNTMRISLLETIGVPSMFPSPTMFFLAAVLTYMNGCVREFERELKTLGTDMNVRSTVAMVLSTLLIFILLCFRSVYGCESIGSLLVSIALGFIMGCILLYQNKSLFGREGINIMNLPLIVTALEKGRPMYVCATD
jgi:hypothetical protein